MQHSFDKALGLNDFKQKAQLVYPTSLWNQGFLGLFVCFECDPAAGSSKWQHYSAANDFVEYARVRWYHLT